MRVAFLGTGIMGAPMARNIHAAGHEVSAWNRSREKAEPLARDGVTVAASVAEAVAGADVVVTMLADAQAVEAVVEEALGALDGAVLVQMSTIGLAATDRLAERAAAAGVAFVDAPVSGTKQPAEQGKLVVLASGPEAVRESVDPVFDAVGAKTVWLGVAGSAQRLKLVLNTWLLGLTEALAEAIALAEALGVDPRTFLETIDGAPVGAPYAQIKGPMMIDGEFPPAFPLGLAAKDAGLALEAAEAAGLRLGALAAVREQMLRAADSGHGDEDMAATIHASRPDQELRDAGATVA
jgi:3-hydroxyisobutyrate dehydrogenase